jgi:multiple sugar transport system substrate-binding protein
VGYPGYANAAIDEIFSTWVISTMFVQAASGKLPPEDAMNQADQEVKRIFKKWKDKGKV